MTHPRESRPRSNRRPGLATALLILALLAHPAGAAGQQIPGCSIPEAHGFDFWIGEWDIQQRILNRDGSWLELPAHTSVTPALDGCALVEHWHGRVMFFWEGMRQPDLMEGLSVRAYDSTDGRWKIYWMDTRSPRFGTPYAGTFAGDRGEFFREWDTPDGHRLGRITFSHGGRESVSWSLSVSRDAGHTWQTIWTMAMRRATASPG